MSCGHALHTLYEDWCQDRKSFHDMLKSSPCKGVVSHGPKFKGYCNFCDGQGIVFKCRTEIGECQHLLCESCCMRLNLIYFESYEDSVCKGTTRPCQIDSYVNPDQESDHSDFFSPLAHEQRLTLIETLCVKLATDERTTILEDCIQRKKGLAGLLKMALQNKRLGGAIYNRLWGIDNNELLLKAGIDTVRLACKFAQRYKKPDNTKSRQAFPANSYFSLKLAIEWADPSLCLLLLEYGAQVEHYDMLPSFYIKKTELKTLLKSANIPTLTHVIFDYLKNKAKFCQPQNFTQATDIRSLAQQQQIAAGFLRNLFTDHHLLPEAQYYKNILARLKRECCTKLVKEEVYPVASYYWQEIESSKGACVIA